VNICRTVEELRALRSTSHEPVGLVPTMGALHAGHESLIERCVRECAASIVSVYVNPWQFGPSEDFASYPRALQDDAALLERLGVDVLFAPTESAMNAADAQVWVEPGPLAVHLEGERRPGHFRGVATVVAKLFNLVQPQRAYFGRKDAQQLAVLERMVEDLAIPVEVVPCDTVREHDGLALSSRNRYLKPEDRQNAPKLAAALRSIAQSAIRGDEFAASMRAAEAQLRPLRRDYLAVVDPREFAPLESFRPHMELLAVGAAFCGTTRLIDNVAIPAAK
jgi:pantoate--beta-alanine ligase